MPPSIAFSQISGLDGSANVGKRTVAATFKSWTMVPGDAPGTWTFAARCKTVDAYWSTQGPDTLMLVFPTKTNTAHWRWSGVHLEISGDSVRATLPGPPEEL